MKAKDPWKGVRNKLRVQSVQEELAPQQRWIFNIEVILQCVLVLSRNKVQNRENKEELQICKERSWWDRDDEDEASVLSSAWKEMSKGFMADSFCAVPGVKERLKRKI